LVQKGADRNPSEVHAMQDKGFVSHFMQSDIFGVAGRVGDGGMFV